MSARRHRERGFSLVELLVATLIFMVICAAMFGLLHVSQQKYAIESQLSNSFGDARLGLDQIVRDINISGYPSAGLLSNTSNSVSYAQAPFAWDPGYLSNTTCQFGAGPFPACSPTPSAFDLIVESDLGDGNGVSWIRYQLQGTILYRGVMAKSAGTDPVTSLTVASGLMTGFVKNVINNASQPIFVYNCTTPSGSQLCSLAAAPYDEPQYLSDIDVMLVVQTPQADPQTLEPVKMELTGRGHRTNTN